MIKKSNEEIVTNLTLVSALLIAGYKVIKRPQWIKSPNGKEQVLFYFERTPELLNDIKHFNEKNDENELFAYFGALEDIKINLIKDIKDKADRFIILENDGKIAVMSADLDDDARNKLLKRFA